MSGSELVGRTGGSPVPVLVGAGEEEEDVEEGVGDGVLNVGGCDEVVVISVVDVGSDVKVSVVVVGVMVVAMPIQSLQSVTII